MIFRWQYDVYLRLMSAYSFLLIHSLSSCSKLERIMCDEEQFIR